jgi:tetratricopeptide (TPR) repeat protein
MAISTRSFLLPLCVFSLLGSAGAAGSAYAADDGVWLQKAAEAEKVKGHYGYSAALLRGLAALRPRDPSPLYDLAEVYQQAGRYEEAIGAFKQFAARKEADPARKARAESEAKRLEEAPEPFSESNFKAETATNEAKRLFDEGKKDAQAKKFDAATAELQASLLLDPDLPGPYRLLGAVYGKTGDRANERLFLADYLRVRPDGKIADTVRQRLKQEKLLGSVTLDSSFPCKLSFNGRETELSTPLKGFALPAGRYKVGCNSEKYQTNILRRVDVSVGKDTTNKFNFGILNIKLDPWARVRVDGKDVGLFDEVGVPEGKHHVEYKAHDGTKEKVVDIEIKGGAREKLSW